MMKTINEKEWSEVLGVDSAATVAVAEKKRQKRCPGFWLIQKLLIWTVSRK